MRGRAVGALLAIGAGLCLAAPSAWAATAQISGSEAFYFAAAGETNDLTVARSGSDFVFSDIVAITATSPCTNTVATTARCPVAGLQGIAISLGDMNDDAAVGASVGTIGGESDEDVSIEGDAGNDDLTGGPGSQNLLFGDGDFSDGPGTDTLTGGSLSDLLAGSDDADQLNGGGGEDEIDGGQGADVVNGGTGGDRFERFFFSDAGADGPDTFVGGPGFDSVSYRERQAAIRADVDNVADDGAGCPGAGCEGDNVRTDVEQVSGGSGNDRLTGNGASGSLNGEDGNDVIDGAGGDDFVLFGGRGDDTVRGGPGDDFSIFGSEGRDSLSGGAGDDTLVSLAFDDDPDVLSGGPGIDLADYTGANSAVKVDTDGRADDGVAGEHDNVRSDVEDINGSEFSDVLIGGKGPSELVGGDGNDKLVGRAGLDGIAGGRGSDRLIGGRGADLFSGDAGADRISARDRGPDQIYCGSAFDSVTADRADRLGADCDRVRRR